MFARKLEFDVKIDKQTEFLRLVRDEVIPILKKAPGYLDILFLQNHLKPEKILVLTLWDKKVNAERYEKESFPRVTEILKPLMTTPFIVTFYNVEATISDHIISAVAA